MKVKVYHYNTLSEAVEAHRVVYSTLDVAGHEAIVVESGIAGQVVRRNELDTGGYFYTTPERAVEAFIAKAEATLACREQYGTLALRSWRQALRAARAALRDLAGSASTKRAVRTTPARASSKRAAQTTTRRSSTK